MSATRTLLVASVLFGVCASAYAEAVTSMPSLERKMLVLVNADRAKQGLGALTWNGAAAAVARSHSRDMALHDFFAHESPTTGLPGDRFFKARIPTTVLAENLARAQSIEEAEDSLLKSPEHYENLMNKDVTELGIGIVRDKEGSLFVTQNFLVSIALVDLPAAIEAWLAKVNAERRDQGARPLKWHAELAAVAEKQAKAMADGGELLEVDAQEILKKRRFRMVGSAAMSTKSIDDLSNLKNIQDPQLDCIGVGAVRNMTSKKGFGMIWISVVLASR